ncbi:hypothetical protein [Catenulispora sp. GP43]|uniref:hypothetical protein n=1 Tax=Catenulispora sp. GP43 TaxID=3156263 RepID=UPI003515B8FF
MDEVTGLAYGAAGDFSGLGDAHEIAELLTLVTEGLHAAGAPGELESVVVTGSRLHEVVHTVPGRAPLNTAVVVLALDRERSNLALAVREAADLAGSILT